jgi:hypothetical protein
MAEHIKGWSMVTIDDFVKDENRLRKLLVFMIKYCYHDVPKDKTNKMIKLEQQHDQVGTPYCLP